MGAAAAGAVAAGAVAAGAAVGAAVGAVLAGFSSMMQPVAPTAAVKSTKDANRYTVFILRLS
jgi:hypothetical protein